MEPNIFISTALFNNLINDENIKILVMDVRGDINYEDICIKCKYIISIHPYYIERGSSIQNVGESIFEENLELFEKRYSFDLVVIMDEDTNSISYNGSKLEELRTILIEEGNYKTLPLVLDGGLKLFSNSYPTQVTEPGQLYYQCYGPFNDSFNEIYIPEKGLRPLPHFMFESDDSSRTTAPAEEQDPLPVKLLKQLEALTMRELDIEIDWKDFSVTQRKVITGEKQNIQDKMNYLRDGLQAVSQKDIKDPRYQSVIDSLKDLEIQVLKARKANKELGYKRLTKRRSHRRKLSPDVESDTSPRSTSDISERIHKSQHNPDIVKPGPSAQSTSEFSEGIDKQKLDVIGPDSSSDISEDIYEDILNPYVVAPDFSALSASNISVHNNKQKLNPDVLALDTTSQSSSDISQDIYEDIVMPYIVQPYPSAESTNDISERIDKNKLNPDEVQPDPSAPSTSNISLHIEGQKLNPDVGPHSNSQSSSDISEDIYEYKLNPYNVEFDPSAQSMSDISERIHKVKLNPDVAQPDPSAQSTIFSEHIEKQKLNPDVVVVDAGSKSSSDISDDMQEDSLNQDVAHPNSISQSTSDISEDIQEDKPKVDTVEPDPTSESTSDIAEHIQALVPFRRSKPMKVSVSVMISQLDWIFKFSGYRGIENIRNTCFMNSTIQCLRAIPSVLCFFYNNFEFIGSYPLTYTLGRTILALWSTNNEYDRGLMPIQFYGEICNRDPQRTGFSRGRHEDAHDFLLYLLSIMNQEVQIPVNPVTTELTAQAQDWLRNYDGCTSFFTTEFYHQFEFTTFCTKCNRKVVKYEYGNTVFIPMNDLSQNFILQDAIDMYLKVETRSCTSCQSTIELKKKLTYYPKVLVVALCRYEYSVEEKTILRRNNRCMFTDDIIFAGIKYNLKAISMHTGNRDCGHYTALTYHIFSKRWIAYNDSRVFYCENIHTKGIYKRAYVLFYTLDSETNINANFFSPPDIKKERAEQEKKDQ